MYGSFALYISLTLYLPRSKVESCSVKQRKYLQCTVLLCDFLSLSWLWFLCSIFQTPLIASVVCLVIVLYYTANKPWMMYAPRMRYLQESQEFFQTPVSHQSTEDKYLRYYVV